MRKLSAAGWWAGVLIACLMLCGPRPARAQEPGGDARACLPAIAAAERQDRLPPKLLDAIALVESGRADPASGRVAPWPWTINAEGSGHFFATKHEAVAAVRALQALGVRSIDVGCLQVNLLHHPHAFASLDEAFDPAANATYGGAFLGALFRQLGAWPLAAAAYHSQTPGIGQAYASRVMAVWPLAGRFAGRHGPAAPVMDLHSLTPAFATQVRRMAADRARLAARFGAMVGRGGA